MSSASAASAKYAEQFVARDAGQPARLALAEAVLELPVGQLHDHHEFVADDLDAFERQEERVADRLDLLERAEFLPEPVLAAAVFGLRARDELDRLVQPARRLALPHLAEAAAPERLQELVPRQRFRADQFRERSVCTALGGLYRRHGRANGGTGTTGRISLNSRPRTE